MSKQPAKKLSLKNYFESEAEQESQSDQSNLNLEDIVLPQSQVRTYFDQSKLEELAKSIKKQGILQPLLLDENKVLIAGERRYRAAKIAGLTTVPVRIIKIEPSEAKILALIENLQREDLNPIEETEGILDLLQSKLNKGREEVVSLLYKLHKKDNNVVISEKILIESTFESIGKISWQSFVSHRLRLLNLPENVLLAVRTGKIDYTKGIAIAVVKDEEIREKLLNTAIEEKLSLEDIKAQIAEFKGKKNTDISSMPIEDLINDFRKISQKISRSKNIWSNDKNRKKIEKLVTELNKLIEQ